MSQVQAALLDNIKQLSLRVSKDSSAKPSILVAFSGGLDSRVLLHGIYQAFQSGLLASVRVAHVNHGLQKEADEWQAFCHRICDQYQLPLLTQKFHLSLENKNSEKAAREVRYHFFEKIIQKDESIVLAHHLNDQSETLLFRLFRGTGLHGLKGMPYFRSLGQGNLLRPFLYTPRDELKAYAQEHQLEWIEDSSNQANDYSRNFLRNKIIPLLYNKWPQLDSSLQSFSQVASDQVSILDEVARDDIKLLSSKDKNLKIDGLKELSMARQKNLLHYWVKVESGLSLSKNLSPSKIEIEEVTSQLSSALESSIKIKIGGGWIRSYDGKLYFCLLEEPKVLVNEIVWNDLSANLLLDNGVELNLSTECTTAEIRERHNLQIRRPLENEVVRVLARTGGESATPNYRRHSTELKKIYQELKVPPWERTWLPIIYYNNLLVAVPGVFVEQSVMAQDGIEFTINY